VETVLATLVGGKPLLSQTLRVDRGEGEIAATLSALAEKYGDLSIGCYPFQINGAFGANVVVRGTDGAQVDAAITELARDLGL
ncbi:MAG: competence/damage-inducible protein A, partial [Tritonibacter mobilis]|nr:competence/damage-inducible protein A [Tritonibacter mobilis]